MIIASGSSKSERDFPGLHPIYASAGGNQVPGHSLSLSDTQTSYLTLIVNNFFDMAIQGRVHLLVLISCVHIFYQGRGPKKQAVNLCLFS